MRWKEVEPPRETTPEYQVITRFLWAPLTIGNETRWLETATYIIRNDRIRKYEDGRGPVQHLVCWGTLPPVPKFTAPNPYAPKKEII